MKEYLFSIIMPAYNASRYIREAIDSVRKQTYSNWQLVIVDDGSTDDTFIIASGYEKNDSRIKVIHQKNSGTAAAARNTALEYVTGDYVQMLDSDDYIKDDLLEKYTKQLNEYEVSDLPDIISPICYSVGEDGSIMGEETRASSLLGKTIAGIDGFSLSLNWSIHGFFCIKYDRIMSIKYDPNLINGDELTTRKFLATSNKIVFCDTAYYYRKNQNSTTRSDSNKLRMYESLLTDYNIYVFSVEKRMPISVRKKCARKFTQSIVAHNAEYKRSDELFNTAQREFAEGIIKTCIQNAQTEKIWRIDKSIFSYAVKSPNKLNVITKIYNYLWRIKH